MSKETKIGLLVGLLFIVVFGLVLSQTGSHGERDRRDAEGAGSEARNPDGAAVAGVPALKPVPLPTGLGAGLSNPDDRRVGEGFSREGDRFHVGQPVATTQKKSPTRSTYRVQRGDKLRDILKKMYGGDFTSPDCANQVLRANSVSTETALLSRSGRDIKLPVLELATAAPPVDDDRSSGTTPTSPGGGRTYTIAQGDTLDRIARRECGSPAAVAKILELNGNLDPRKLKIGQVLKLPESAGARR